MTHALTIAVTDDNVGLVLGGDKVIYRTRPCRLSVQAHRLAQEWIERELGVTYPDAVALDVQSLSIDTDQLFSRYKGANHG